MVLVAWEMFGPKLLIRHGEALWVKFLLIELTCTLDVAGTPASVYELPFAVVDPDGVPGMACIVRREW